MFAHFLTPPCPHVGRDQKLRQEYNVIVDCPGVIALYMGLTNTLEEETKLRCSVTGEDMEARPCSR